MIRSGTTVDWIGRARGLKLGVRDFIDGQWHSVGGAELDKFSARDGKFLFRLGSGDVRAVEEAVASARRAFEDGRWSRMPVQNRKEVLLKLVSLMEEKHEELALLECLDVGKPIRDALDVDVPMAQRVLRFSAEAADKLFGKVYGVDSSSFCYQLKRPVGVVGGIVGWNFPLVLAASKIGPALATGNCLVLKPSEITSLSAARLAELALEAGVPSGVLNVIHGTANIGAALAHHRDVDLITFTGSTQTGKRLLIASGESNMKRLILECGGKAPNIVFDDAPDLDVVIDAIVARAFWNQGQVCSASSRLVVQESIKEEVLDRLVSKVATLTPADPLLPDTTFAAVVSREHQQKVQNFIDIGERQGARLVHRSRTNPPFADGFYVNPTIFDDVLPEHRIAQEEIFGPVLSVLTFPDEDEAIHIANQTIYGLSAILWTRDAGRGHRVSQGLQAGSIIVNTTGNPTGGPGEGVVSVGGHKQSGLGVEGGLEGLEGYTTSTAVQWFV